jgi:hypothetical protein
LNPQQKRRQHLLTDEHKRFSALCALLDRENEALRSAADGAFDYKEHTTRALEALAGIAAVARCADALAGKVDDADDGCAALAGKIAVARATAVSRLAENKALLAVKMAAYQASIERLSTTNKRRGRQVFTNGSAGVLFDGRG